MQERRILGVILAGGTGRRFGADKYTALLDGQTLLERVIARARPQVETLVLNANTKLETASEIERFADDAPGEGPLAGVLAGLKRAEERGFTQVASFACDTPFFPRDTVARLAETLHNSSTNYAVARYAANVHRIFALWPVSCGSRLKSAFASGARSMQSVEDWVTPAFADFPAGAGPCGDPFFNINTPADLETAGRWLSEHLSDS